MLRNSMSDFTKYLFTIMTKQFIKHITNKSKDLIDTNDMFQMVI